MECVPSLQELLKGISKDKLNSTCSDVDLARISELIVDWKELAPFLSLTEADEAIIKNENSSYPLQKLEMLRLWKSKTKQDATYRQLARIFHRQHKNDLVEKVRDILLNPSELPPTVPMNTLERYQFFLQQAYKSLPHPGFLVEQWPLLKSISPVYTNLTMRDSKCKTPQDAISSLQGEYPLHLGLPIDYGHNEIELHQLFDRVGRATNSAKRILIQGCPGSGKSTLTWNASQKWAENKVFQNFSLFISIPLCSQNIQEAKSLVDVIPHTNREEQKAIANVISRNQGSKVCFWFDGWDELPRDIQKGSYVAHFIRGDRVDAILSASAVVVTARHESRFLRGESFHRVVDINGLTKRQVQEMVINSTKNTPHDPVSLLRILGVKHHLQIFCSLPITVTILIYLFFCCSIDLPDTQTELFRLLILNLLLRNLTMRNLIDSDDYTLGQFEDLPKPSLKCFRSLCQLAFQGVTETKTSFCRRELPNLQVSLPEATLGLMSISPRCGGVGMEQELSFLHFTVQEFLAAVHISILDPEEQVTKVRELIILKQSNTLLFYAGFTKLEESPTFDTIHKAATEFSWTHLILDKNLHTFFMLMNCLYETQSPELCHLVKPLPNDSSFNLYVSFNLTFRLNVLDLCSFAYFVANYSQKNSCYLYFHQCGGIGVFAEQLRLALLNNNIHNQQEIALKIDPSWMSLPSFNELQALGHLLQSAKMIKFLELSLDFCFIKAVTSGATQLLFPTLRYHVYKKMLSFHLFHVTMKYMVESLSRSTSCRIVRLKGFFYRYVPNVIIYFEYYLVLLLSFCPSIDCLALEGLLCDDHNYYLFSAALKLRMRGKEPFCIDLTDNTFLNNRLNLLLFADVLCTSCAIGKVVLYKSLSSDMLSVILEKLVQNWSSPLQKIYIDISPSCEQIELIGIINRTRMMMTMTDIHFVLFTVVVKNKSGQLSPIIGI